MDWWIWVLFGLGLVALEVVIPGAIVFLFFGVAAIVVGVLVALGLGGPLWWQALLFAFLSVVSLLTLRGPILRRFKAGGAQPDTIDTFVGQHIVLEQDLPPESEGQATLRGTSWIVRNGGAERLAKGSTCVVEKVEGLKLFVRGR